MRHRLYGRSFSRTSAHRKAMFENLAAALIKHEQITHDPAEGQGSAPDRRAADHAGQAWRSRHPPPAIAALQDAEFADKLMTTLAERYGNRAGGYTRIIKAGFRYGDNAAMALIELVDRDPEAKGKDSGPTRGTEKKPRPKPPQRLRILPPHPDPLRPEGGEGVTGAGVPAPICRRGLWSTSNSL